MTNYFIWFKIHGDLENHFKSIYSKNIHNFIFRNGIKLKKDSNAFFYKGNINSENLSNQIKNLASGNIRLIVINMDHNEYQGWLNKEQWNFLN